MPLAPVRVGPLTLDPPLALAPMAGQTNHAFRMLVREQGGCGLVCSELISSNALQHRSSDRRSRELFNWTSAESPVAVQLFGGDPAVMAEAARVVADLGADVVDINMGCWVPKVAKKGGGAGLLRDVCTARAVVEAVVKAVSVPVTVKVRVGWDHGERTAAPFAKAAAEVGVAAVAVHGRTAAQGFTGQADWDAIAEVVQAVPGLPVFGNGDVFSAADARRMLAQTGCAGVMIGRAALGAPWIFRHIEHELRTGEALPEPTREERRAVALRHALLTLETSLLVEKQALLELRGQLCRYRLDDPGSTEVRDALVRVSSRADLERILA